MPRQFWDKEVCMPGESQAGSESALGSVDCRGPGVPPTHAPYICVAPGFRVGDGTRECLNRHQPQLRLKIESARHRTRILIIALVYQVQITSAA